MGIKNFTCKVVVITFIFFLAFAQSCFAKHYFPNTNNGVHVFNDQLAQGLNWRQVRFAATHYDGCQKILRREAQRLRKFNPKFVVLHYRLGGGLGYQNNEEWLYIINGNNWVREWPQTTQPEWFYQYSGSNVFFNPNGWYLMELNNSSWRSYWTAQIKNQMANNQNDGLFADSFSVPSYFGPENFTPNLPDFDLDFENQWSTKLESFTRYVKQSFGSNYYFIPNAGFWVTSRDKTNYTVADGVMIEGFGAWNASTPFDIRDWKLQMNRILSMERHSKAVIAQSYLDSAKQTRARMFFLSNYLLIKGQRTYINMDMGFEPEWFPEYNTKIGRPVSKAPLNIKSLYTSSGVYRRAYTNGLVLLNPSSVKRTIRLGRYLYKVIPSGGGFIDSLGRARGKLSYRRINRITMAAWTGAVLLKFK